MTGRQVRRIQLRAVRGDADFYKRLEKPVPDVNVRYQGQPGKHMLALSSSQFDPERTSERGRARVG